MLKIKAHFKIIPKYTRILFSSRPLTPGHPHPTRHAGAIFNKYMDLNTFK